MMRNWKRWLILTILAVTGLGAAYLIFSYIFLDFMVDLWWFRSLELSGYYWLRLFYKYLVFALVSLVFFLIFFFNFYFASRFLGSTSPPAAKGTTAAKDYRYLFSMFRKGSLRVYTPVSFLLTIPVAFPMYQKWEESLLFFFGVDSGLQEPVFGNDISYYLFSYPIYSLLQNRLLIIFSLLFVFILILYFLEKRILNRENKGLPKGAKIHLSILFIVVALIHSWGYILKCHSILYTNAHMPLFYGPGYLEMRYYLPLIWITLAVFLLSAFFLLIYVHTRRWRKFLIFFIFLFAVIQVLRNTDYIPNQINALIVKPNEIVREKPYINRSISTTLDAFGLEKVVTRQYHLEKTYEIISKPDVQKSLRNIPVWDRHLLDDLYSQLQGIRTYYSFPSVDVDRYTVAGRYQQVYLAGRELNLEKLPSSARSSWVNRHLKYTHGHGVVMTPAAQEGEEPVTWYVQSIPMSSDYNINTEEPDIYYGLGKYQYIIVPNDIGEFELSEEGDSVTTNYRGEGGVPVSSLFKKFMFYLYFKDQNLLFTTKTNKDSKIIFRRNIQDCITRISPFLLMDSDPYLVLTSTGLFWIQDAYTLSSRYPYVEPTTKGINRLHTKDKLPFNYIRNSVKIVADAYNGDINYYIADGSDPVIETYKRIYPGLFKDIIEMPAELLKHIRYPKDFFETQMTSYARYHQQDVEIFYQQEDTWEFAQMDEAVMKSYYLTLNLLNPKQHQFMLLCPMRPVGRDNLRALAIAGCDLPYSYGKIVVYSFPRGKQVYGPKQINSLIDQDTYVAQELTLWDQAGSEVRRGRMIIFPVENNILYIQPVYLRSAEGPKIPELKRIIVTQGNIVAMDSSIEGAIKRLEQKLLDEEQRQIEKEALTHPPPVEDSPVTSSPPGEKAPQDNLPGEKEAGSRKDVKEKTEQPTQSEDGKNEDSASSI